MDMHVETRKRGWPQGPSATEGARRFVTATLVAAATLLAACGAQDTPEPSTGTAPGSVVTPSSLPTDPFLTDSRVRSQILATKEDGTDVIRLCEADARVNILVDARGAKAKSVVRAPAGFQFTPDEPVYFPDGSVYRDPGLNQPTLVGGAVYRDDDGRLIGGWRHCEDAPPGATLQPGGPIP
jgi:hypothetical protein